MREDNDPDIDLCGYRLNLKRPRVLCRNKATHTVTIRGMGKVALCEKHTDAAIAAGHAMRDKRPLEED